MIFEYLLSIAIGSFLGFGIGIILTRYFGKYMVRAMLNSITKSTNEKQEMIKIEIKDLNEIKLSLNLPKIIESIRKKF